MILIGGGESSVPLIRNGKKGREDKEKQGVKRISEERLMGAFLGGMKKD